MADGPGISEQNAERARKLQELERLSVPYRKPNALWSYLVLVIALAIAGVIVYSIMANKQQFVRFWQRATHPGTVPAQTEPGQ